LLGRCDLTASQFNYRDTTVGAPAFRIGRCKLQITLILIDGSLISSLLKINVGDMDQRNFEVRFECEGTLIFLNSFVIATGPTVTQAQTVMGIRLIRGKLHIALEHCDGLIMPSHF